MLIHTGMSVLSSHLIVLKFIASIAGIKIKQFHKRRVRITTNIGLIIGYDGVFNVFVKVDSRYQGKLSGLCGNFNGKSNDDFRTPKNDLVKNAALFGNSWKLDKSCPNVTRDENPCKAASKIAKRAKKECSILKQKPFSVCNKILNPDNGHIANCEYDVCVCNNPNACLCEVYSAYVEECKDAGIEIKWKHLPAFAKCGKFN